MSPLTITADEALLRTLVESLQESSKLIMALIYILKQFNIKPH